MTMYNMLFGKNPSTNEILSLLSLTEGMIERYRDCWIFENDDGTYGITIYTRTGGLNREDYPNKVLTEHPNYLFDEDDDFDNTYAYYHFSIPKEKE